MSATKEQLIQVLDDIKALGFDLSDADDKASVYSHIASNDSSYICQDDTIIENISIKYLFKLYHLNSTKTKLKPKAWDLAFFFTQLREKPITQLHIGFYSPFIYV